jgi:C-terminal processing protease CtpA/Prc
MVAAALQDARAAKVFGVKSPGLVNTSRYFPVAGGGLQITVARAYTGPKKRLLSKAGVTPDDVVALPGSGVSPWRDTQIDHAINYLRTNVLVSAAH